MLLKQIKSVIFLPFLMIALNACTTNIRPLQTQHKIFVPIENTTALLSSSDDSWQIEVSENAKQFDTTFYNLLLLNKHNPAYIKNIQYRYGEYGKWRPIEKQKYAQSTKQFKTNNEISNFPVTIKKSGTPHHQTLKVILNFPNGSSNQLHLVFGVEKCIAKKEKEVTCF